MKPFIFTKDFFTKFGIDRKIAKIKATEQPSYERDKKCLDINYNNKAQTYGCYDSVKEYELKVLELKKKYGNIDDCIYECEKEILIYNQKDLTELNLKLLDIKKKHNEISELDYQKEKNTILKKPWAVFKMTYDEHTDSENAGIEVVYNEFFIDRLKKMGYSGLSEDDVVEAWLSQVFASNINVGDIVRPYGE